MEKASKAPPSETRKEKLVNLLEDRLALPPSRHVLYPCGGWPSAMRLAAWAMSIHLYWAEAKPTALSPWSLVRAAPGGQGPSPALPDGVGDAPDTDAVGGLRHSLCLACLPAAAAPLQGRRPSARHPPGLGPHRLPPSRCQPGA